MEVTLSKFSVDKDMRKYEMNNNDGRRSAARLLAYFRTLVVEELRISVEQGRVVTTLNIIIH